jgi:hypothetical protein
MNYENDLLLSFRAISGESADLARSEAKAVHLALSESSVGVTVAVQRLRLIVKHIETASDGMLESIEAFLDEHPATPDEADEILAVVDETIALNEEMSALLLTTTAAIRADMKHNR